MPVKKRVADLMIPLSRYSVVPPDATLKQAIFNLKNAYCDQQARICKEVGPRTVFVVDDDGRLKGMLDFQTILRFLIPEVSGGLTARLQALGISVTYAEGDAPALDEARSDFHARVIKNANTRVNEIMLKVKGSIQVDADLLEALKIMFRHKITSLPVYKKDRLIGVLRDRDLFLAVSDILTGA